MNLDRLDDLATSLTALQMQVALLQRQVAWLYNALTSVSTDSTELAEAIDMWADVIRINTIDHVALKVEVSSLREAIEQPKKEEKIKPCEPKFYLPLGYSPR